MSLLEIKLHKNTSFSAFVCTFSLARTKQTARIDHGVARMHQPQHSERDDEDDEEEFDPAEDDEEDEESEQDKEVPLRRQVYLFRLIFSFRRP